MPKQSPTPMPAGKVHGDFVQWAVNQAGIQINKIKVAAFEGAGIGIVATEDIKPGEIIAHTPTSALLTRECLPNLAGKYELTTHALLALGLATQTYKDQKPWQAVWPTYQSFENGIPLLWDKKECDYLPDSTKVHLEKQRKKFNGDFKRVNALGMYNSLKKEEYAYAWIIVNTRTLFYKPPSYNDVAREDCMSLCPFIDYFNHLDEGCQVTLSSKGFTVTADRFYSKGTQVCVSYGAHNNDFLLCEYGFLLGHSKWDEVNIDSYILPLLSLGHKGLLEKESFLGTYHFDANIEPVPFCFRTQVAVRLSLIPERQLEQNMSAKLQRWRRFVEGSDDDDGEMDMDFKKVLKGVLEQLKSRAVDVLAELEIEEEEEQEEQYNHRVPERSGSQKTGWPVRRFLIIGRWRQILEMISSRVVQDWFLR